MFTFHIKHLFISAVAMAVLAGCDDSKEDPTTTPPVVEPGDNVVFFDDFDSFITHRSRKSDMEKVKRFGIDAYNAEQAEKANILEVLLSNYNDGRKKTLFCVAVNLLGLQELQTVLREIERKPDMETLTLKEKALLLPDYCRMQQQQKILT